MRLRGVAHINLVVQLDIVLRSLEICAQVSVLIIEKRARRTVAVLLQLLPFFGGERIEVGGADVA